MRDQIESRLASGVRSLIGVLACGLILGLVTPGEAAAATYKIAFEGSGSGSVASNPTGLNCSGTSGSASGECSFSNFPGFTSVELTASPAGPGSQFEGWSRPEGEHCNVGAPNPCSFTTSFGEEEYTITAHFGSTGPQQPLEVKLIGAGGGEVTSSPTGIECGTKCDAEFSEGATAVLIARENEHSTFAGWIGCSNVTVQDKCEVTMGVAKTVEAKFDAIPQQTLEVQKTGSGEVTSSPSGIECGATCTNHFNEHSTVTLTAIPAPAIPGARYTFGGWTGCNTVTAEDKCEVTMSETKVVEAKFGAIPQQALTVQETGSGEITSSPSGISCGGTCEAEFDEGAAVTLTATAASGSYFTGWSGGGCTGTARCEVTLSAATNVAASFQPVPSPTATTGEAIEITQTTVRFSGLVNGQGFDTHYFFDYGETESYGNKAPVIYGGEDAGVIATNTTETAEVSSLIPNTTYHYKIFAYNVPCSPFCPQSGANTVEGGERTFTTLPLGPAVATDVPGSVGSDAAVVGGEVFAQGAQTSYHVEYGATQALGSNTPPTDAGSATTGRYVTMNLEGLSPDTTYYYRIAASNQGGQAYGDIATFTTNTLGEVNPGVPMGFSLTGTAPSTPVTMVYPNLTSLTPATAAKTTTNKPVKPKARSCKAKARAINRARKRRAALKGCRKAKARKNG